jgi:transcriptional regulator with XRE-family HTH domain
MSLDIIAKNIKKHRIERGYTQKEFAKMIDKAHITVRKYETGDIMPSQYSLLVIAEVLGVTREDIVKDKGDMIKKEMVNHPSHYNMGKYEAIDVIEDWNLGFNLGNTVKYISRAGHKDDIVQDLKKALWYLEREIKRLEK